MVVAPYTQKTGVTFTVVVDTADVFGQAFGLKAIPESFLVDEVGIIRLHSGGPSTNFLKQVEQVLMEPLAQIRGTPFALPSIHSRSELEDRIRAVPGDWQARLALAHQLNSAGQSADAFEECEKAAKLQPKSAAVYFTWGVLLLEQKQNPAALAKLKEARDLEPDNWRIRKQIWAIEHPEKFYKGQSPDYDWQTEQLARERKP